MAHHFYPVLFYFRFRDVFYATPRVLLLALDAAALIRTALDADELGWLQESAAAAELERASAMLLRTLMEVCPAGGAPAGIDPHSHERWAQRYQHALRRLREAGIATRADADVGVREYAELRARWQPGLDALMEALGWTASDADPAAFGRHPERIA